MSYTRLGEGLFRYFTSVLKRSRFLALALVATFTAVAMQPAQAQSADRWKSIAIIGGSTAVGAYVGHKVAGGTGALIGAGVGASTGYAIDKRRRDNQYYNEYAYDDGGNGYYGNNGGYNGNSGYSNDGGYYRNSGNNGQYDNGAYSSGYQNNNCSDNNRRTVRRR